MPKLLIRFTLFSFLVLSRATGQNISAQPSSGNDLYSLSCANMVIVIDGSVGARITSLTSDGKEIIGSKDLHPRFYGSTLWLSPEGKWKGHGLLDNGPYSIDKVTSSELQMTSVNDTLRGFTFIKRFITNPEDTSIIIRYTIINTAKQTQDVAAWEVTRVPTGGLAVVPKGSPDNNPTPNAMYPLLTVIDSIGAIWYPYDSSVASAQKLFMEGGEGWMAYVHDNMVFIKKIPVIESWQAAPNEKNIEIYVNREKTYVELENQGPYEKLDSGDSLSYEVIWYARRLPVRLKAEVGNKALIDYIRSIVITKAM
jgi:hypothetical protein